MQVFITIPGAGRIFYKQYGAGPPIILLHPVGLDAFLDPIISGISSGYKVYALDFRGHGQSDRPSEPFTLDDLTRDVIQFCKLLNLNRIILCGLSMGGMVAQKVALEEPTLISALILADTTTKTVPDLMLQRAKKVENGGMAEIIPETLERWFTGETLQHKPELINLVKERLLADDPVVHGLTWRAMADLDLTDRLTEISCPCLIICGDQDQSTPPMIANEMKKRINRSSYSEISDASHMSLLEQPEAFAKAIRDFLKKNSIHVEQS